MKILQWSMMIPKEKQNDFEVWFNKIAGSKLNKFGAVKHELYKVVDNEIVGRQTIEKDKYIERIYFNNDFDIPKYFSAVKANPEAWKTSRMYEEKFGANNIELRVLYSI
jgi:hypothetical protein